MLLILPGNRVLNAGIDGSGLPTIILPTNLSHLKSRLAANRSGGTSGTFFVYEARGSGASGPGPLPRTTTRIVADLEQALTSADLRPPHIIAGYSATGFEALLFAYRNKQHTRGLILIDPSIPFMNQNLYRISPMLRTREEEGRRLLAERLSELKRTASYSETPEIERLAKLECQLSEWDNLHTGSSEEIAAILNEPEALDGVPLLVLSAGKFDVEEFCRDEIKEHWHSAHSAYAHLSSNGEHRILDEFDHWSISHQSDLLVSAMQEMIKQAASDRAAPIQR